MGNSLDQYRASIGLNNAGKRSNRKAPDVFWVALKDLLLTLLVLQVLLSGLVALQLHVYHQLSIGVGEEAFFLCPLVRKVGNRFQITLHVFSLWVGVRGDIAEATKLFQDCLLFVFQVSESLQEFQEEGSFSILKKNLLVREGMESNPGPRSIGETLEWYRENQQNGKLSEAKIKSESLKFFHLSSESQMKDKKLFKRALEGLVSAHTKSQKNLLREVLKMHIKWRRCFP